MVLSTDDRKRVLRRIGIIEVAIEELRDIIGTDWITVATTKDGYIKVDMYDYDELTGDIASNFVAVRNNSDHKLELRDLIELEEGRNI